MFKDYIGNIEEKLEAARQEAKDRLELQLDLIALGVAIVFPGSILVRALTWVQFANDAVNAMAEGEVLKFVEEEVVKHFIGGRLKRHVPILAPQIMFKVTKSATNLAVTSILLNTKRANDVIEQVSDYAVEKAFCALSDEEGKLSETEKKLLVVHRLRLQIDPSYPGVLKKLSEIAKDQKFVREKRIMYEIDHR